MEGRRRIVLASWGILVAVASGCNRHATLPNNPSFPPAQAESSSFPEVSQFFGSKTDPALGKPPEQAVAPPKTKRKPGEPLKPETEVALAETEIEAAFAEGRTTPERDQLLDSARQRFQRALKKQPKSADALLGLARLYTLAGDAERAMETYRVAMRTFPNDHTLAHRVAVTQAKFGDWAGAVESCRVALSMDPENRTYQKTLGFALAQVGDWDEAYAVLARVMTEAEAHYFLGRMLYDLDNVDEARQQMRFALAADPRHALAKQFLADLDAGLAAAPGDGIRTVGYAEAE